MYIYIKICSHYLLISDLKSDLTSTPDCVHTYSGINTYLILCFRIFKPPRGGGLKSDLNKYDELLFIYSFVIFDFI